MSSHSGVYWGVVGHRRLMPQKHQLRYKIMQWCFDLKELSSIHCLSKFLSVERKRWAPLHFKDTDYLKGYFQPEYEDIHDAVLRKMNDLSDQPLSGNITFLGNIRNWGIYFSPINCFFLRNTQGLYTHMLAEVSNTPWNERHYYLVDLEDQQPTQKAFHVSPFNPMDMTYHWRIKAPKDTCVVHIGVKRHELEFDATLKLSKQELNSKSIRSVLRKHPIQVVKIVWGIYWHAVKLFLKKVPIYKHP
ncbi:MULTISPECIES: DUF1365 domain-containing protein [Gammaproteobacteria]|uniref:DUF1365 domain-containing protein n=1 Tax=Gammaproteobacteria TaxID=1236 RepID=UPI000DD03B61|nr:MULTISPECIES: DUF1365 domain-containing protein [Gammaproteobacteria]RTE87319.1 DUF1365 domain-containing protein [Aliidiomarina sp. B3213]TCZ92895.1 DUF1365 domain-containing protein [Lysobacter sp. N42]